MFIIIGSDSMFENNLWFERLNQKIRRQIFTKGLQGAYLHLVGIELELRSMDVQI